MTGLDDNSAKPVFQPVSRMSVAERIVLGTLVTISLLSAVYPFARAFYRFEINYNEGWNVYNAQAARSHLVLFDRPYGWTTVNYPLLSFYLIGYLSKLGEDYLLTGRMISLVSLTASCVLVGLIVKKLTANRAPAVFAAAFCLGLFCTAAPQYVGTDDPQMLAHPFFLVGLLVYLTAPLGNSVLATIALLFVLGGNIKHNLLTIPISVLLDLFFRSRARLVRFMLFAGIFVAASMALEILVGGPFFFTKLLTPPPYSVIKAYHQFLVSYVWLQLPFAVASLEAIRQLRDPRGRAIAFYFFASLLAGVAYGGGWGININTYFDNFLAMSILMGTCLDLCWKLPLPTMAEGRRGRIAAPLVLYFCVLMIFGFRYSDLPGMLVQLPNREKLYRSEVSFLAARPGPALCESLLRCYDAGKPYVYDPFNSTSLVHSGKLDSREIVEQIGQKKYGAIETSMPVIDFERPNERFPNEVLEAIHRHYAVGWRDFECVIYIPRPPGSSAPD